MIAALSTLLPSRARAQLSPGPLAKAHAGLEGATNCVQCHGIRREPMSQICLGCHKDVQWMLDQGHGLHAREVRSAKKECASCHPDHAGPGFALIAWNEGSAARFDHARAGWPLEGKHAQVTCERCHAPNFRVSPAASLSKRRAGAGWIGLEPACASCHRDDDVHRNSLGARCDACHDARDWKRADRFEHVRSAYPLTGKHTDVACDKCHRAARLGIKPNAKGERLPVFRPVPFRECSSCHDDPHKGRLAGKCADCHVTQGWGVMEKKEFNHAATRYPLEGKHRTVQCEGCHGANLARPNPGFATCGSCHADAHRGEATLAGRPADCTACHRLSGFAPSTFSVTQHNASNFLLKGKHAQVKCSGCHASGGAIAGRAPGTAANVRLRPPSGRCADCHVDAHGTQLSARADKGTCESCHAEVGWTPSTFSVASHAALRFPLDGRHATVTCAACHGAQRPGLPTIVRADNLGSAHVLLAVPERECQSCHADPHAGRYARGGARSLEGGCSSCHGTLAFRPARVDVGMHARFSFPLDGAHRATPCVACHAEFKVLAATSTLVRNSRGVMALPFTATRSTTCASCHASPHGSQFATRKDGGACEGCHEAARFAPATKFDHERDASFSLRGAHARVACAKCHRAPAGAGPMIVYLPLSGRCETCHSGRVPKVLH